MVPRTLGASAQHDRDAQPVTSLEPHQLVGNVAQLFLYAF